MAKRRVIEDSDDEDNTEGTPPPKPAAGSSAVDLENSPGQESVQQSAAPSTGSTGASWIPCVLSDRAQANTPQSYSIARSALHTKN